MLREVVGSSIRILLAASISLVGIACAASTGSASAGSALSAPTIVIAPVGRPLAAGSGVRVAGEASAPPRAPVAIAWNTSEREARDRSRRERVPLLVYVRADWAAACAEMERSAWLDPRVTAEVRGFVALRLDVSAAEGDAELYAQRYGVTAIPEVVVVDPAGRTLARHPGAFDADALALLLRRALEE